MSRQKSNSISLYLRQETSLDRWQRMWVCAVVGLASATLLTWTMATINIITLAHQHIGLDWQRLWFYWGGFAIIAGVEGLIVGWFTEHYEGITFGWMPVFAVLLLGYSLYIHSNQVDPLTASISFLGIVETVGVLILLAVILRLVGNELIKLYEMEEKDLRRKRLLYFAGGIALLVVVIGGFNRFDSNEVKALRSFNDSMVRVGADPSLESRLPVNLFPEFRSHEGMNYHIYPRTDTASVGMYVFPVVFEDGFAFTCRVNTTENYDIYYFTTDCSRGVDLSFP